MIKTIWFIFAGILGGVLAGMGMGGGTLLIPLLSIFYAVEQHTAQAINLISFVPMAGVVLLIHAKNRLIETKGLAFIIIPAIICSVVASLISKNISGELLKKVFGGFLIALSILQFFADKIGAKTNIKEEKNINQTNST